MHRRIRSLKISEEFFFSLFTSGFYEAGYTVLSNAIPKDAKLVNVRFGWPHEIEILIESQEFEEVGEGEIPPYLTPVIRKEHSGSE